ncbi:MAG: hypothetical protein IJX38_02190 [Clostridia bacterium]|nr:hypothetical protein [Clostridia bacterium]MBQ8371738.1 hypothetical protein [Clostridia bacterium]
MKKSLKITLNFLIVLALCVPLCSCINCLSEFHPYSQSGTYWETTDSSISFCIWDGEMERDWQKRADKCSFLRMSNDLWFVGRGQITYKGKITDVLVCQNQKTYDEMSICFYSVDILDFYLSGEWLSEEYFGQTRPERVTADEKRFSYLYLKVKCKSADKAILTVTEWDGIYGAFESKAFEIGTEFELRRIDPS